MFPKITPDMIATIPEDRRISLMSKVKQGTLSMQDMAVHVKKLLTKETLVTPWNMYKQIEWQQFLIKLITLFILLLTTNH